MNTGDSKPRAGSGAGQTQPVTRPAAAGSHQVGTGAQQGDGGRDGETTDSRPMQAFSASSSRQQGDADVQRRQRPGGPLSGRLGDSPDQAGSMSAGGRVRPDLAAGANAGAQGNEYGRYSGGYGARTPLGEDAWRAGRSPHEVSWTGRPEPGRPFDPEYHRWRAEQVRRMDMDYETWRQERYDKFCEEFDRWRAGRAAATLPVAGTGLSRRDGSGN